MEDMRNLAFRTTLSGPFERAVEKTVEALKSEGFGVLTQIDIQSALKEKLGKDFRRYLILGACNPPFAYKALQADLEVGLMLPCNLIVYEDDQGQVQLAALNPVSALEIMDRRELKQVADEVSEKLRRVVDRAAE